MRDHHRDPAPLAHRENGFDQRVLALAVEVRIRLDRRDQEDEHDGREPDEDEPSLGSFERINQIRWGCGETNDLEHDMADDEPSLGAPNPQPGVYTEHRGRVVESGM